jgi:3',5'-cyclic AMP phosphodiesterase CpdA
MRALTLRFSVLLSLAVSCTIGAADPTRIALLADTHTNRGTKDEQPLYHDRLERVIDSVNQSTVSLVLVAGDLTENGKEEEYADFKQQIKRFTAPVLVVPGNHDVGMKWMPEKPDTVSTSNLSRYESQVGPSWYDKQVAGLRVIGLNSSLLGSGLPQAQQQWTWLEDTLKADTKSTTVVFMHYPPFRDYPDEPGGGYWNIEPKPRARLLADINQANVRAIFSGHTHQSLVNHYGTIPIVTGEPVSFGLPKGRQPEGWTLVLMSPSGEVHVEYMNLPK